MIYLMIDARWRYVLAFYPCDLCNQRNHRLPKAMAAQRDGCFCVCPEPPPTNRRMNANSLTSGCVKTPVLTRSKLAYLSDTISHKAV